MIEEGILRFAIVHARHVLPEESCGLVAGGEYIPCFNTHPDPCNHFRIDPKSYIEAQARYGKIDALIHSHTDGTNFPSKDDQISQASMGIPWGILPIINGAVQKPVWFGDQVPDAPLEGREFVAGHHDCYGLVRSWYRQRMGIELPDFPRDNWWWDKGENLFTKHFTEAGFKPIYRIEKIGDAVVGKIRAKVPNHCGVYVGHGLILHHLYNRLSRFEPIGPWMKYVTNTFRYVGTKDA